MTVLYPESTSLIPLLYYFVLLCKSFKDLALTSRFRFFVKADAKIRTFSNTLQIFSELFSKKVFRFVSICQSLAALNPDWSTFRSRKRVQK